MTKLEEYLTTVISTTKTTLNLLEEQTIKDDFTYNCIQESFERLEETEKILILLKEHTEEKESIARIEGYDDGWETGYNDGVLAITQK